MSKRRKPRQKGRYARFHQGQINTGQGPNPVAVQEYYARAKTLSEEDFKDRKPTPQSLVLPEMTHNEIKLGFGGLFQSERLQGFESYQLVKLVEHGDISMYMLSFGDKHVFIERRQFPPTVDSPKGDCWIKWSREYRTRKLAMTAFNCSYIRWEPGQVNQPDKVVSKYITK